MKKERLQELAGVQLNEAAQKKFAVSVAWSQTDHETVLVSASDKKDAERIVKEKLEGIHHITGTLLITKEL